MIELTDSHSGCRLILAANAIATAVEAGVSSQWHGTKTNIKLWDGSVYGVCEDIETVKRLQERAKVQA